METSTPAANTTEQNAQERVDNLLATVSYSNAVPIARFIALSISTFGIYTLLWFYQSWKLLVVELKLTIQPFLRAWFAAFFTISFAKYIKKLAAKYSIPNEFNAEYLGIAYFMLLIGAGMLPSPFWVISICSFVPLLPLLQTLNMYYAKVEGGKLKVKELSMLQTGLISFGIALVILAVYTGLTFEITPGLTSI
jgi:hypothetical protein